MAGPTDEFFEELRRRGHEPLLAATTGTIRFDLGHATNGGESRSVSIGRGDVRVSDEGDDGAAADCVVRTDRALFDAIASGRANAMAAMLRGALSVDGDVELLVLFQRLFPGPPHAHGPRPAAITGRPA